MTHIPPLDPTALATALAALPERKASKDLKRLVQSASTWTDLAAGIRGAISWEDTVVLLRLVREVLGDSGTRVMVDAAQVAQTPTFHHGHLEVRGPLDLNSTLFVTGDLVVHGFARDREHDSVLAVGGNATFDALLTSGEVHVLGTLTATTLVYGLFNDHVLSAHRVHTPLLLADDHAIDARRSVTHDLDLYDDAEDAIEVLRGLIDPALIVPNPDEDDAPDVVDRFTLIQRLERGDEVLQRSLPLPELPVPTEGSDEGDHTVVYVVTSCEDGRDLAHACVSERLAAKASLIAVEEVYHWHDGELVEEEEMLVIFETTPALVDDLWARIEEEHDDEVPSIARLTPSQLAEAYGRRVHQTLDR